eukprot:12923501-Prorocentrum_lima.AAC.1
MQSQTGLAWLPGPANMDFATRCTHTYTPSLHLAVSAGGFTALVVDTRGSENGVPARGQFVSESHFGLSTTT